PHAQEWIKFKVRTLTACLGRLSRAIARRDPECAVGADLLHGLDTGSESCSGISYPAHVPLVDFVRPPTPVLNGSVNSEICADHLLFEDELSASFDCDLAGDIGEEQVPPAPPSSGPRFSAEGARSLALAVQLKTARAFG